MIPREAPLPRATKRGPGRILEAAEKKIRSREMPYGVMTGEFFDNYPDNKGTWSVRDGQRQTGKGLDSAKNAD